MIINNIDNEMIIIDYIDKKKEVISNTNVCERTVKVLFFIFLLIFFLFELFLLHFNIYVRCKISLFFSKRFKILFFFFIII